TDSGSVPTLPTTPRIVSVDNGVMDAGARSLGGTPISSVPPQLATTMMPAKRNAKRRTLDQLRADVMNPIPGVGLWFRADSTVTRKVAKNLSCDRRRGRRPPRLTP